METASSSERQLRTHTEPLPRTADEVITRFKQAISLPDVFEITVSAHTHLLTVQRMVLEHEEVFPKVPVNEETLDPAFVISHLELVELPFSPDAYPYHCAEEATRIVMGRSLLPSHLFAPAPEYVAAYFDLPDEPPPAHVFGMKVVYSDSPTCLEKFVVVGGTSHFLSDAKLGVLIDIGV